ncbi:MAG: hypothetical protein A2X35_03630 [Elusimicrobia bacterium GWA2_61_42]|nr:MAG: hypothetical protein A2X35_03630 [Elusimicrobia bacterium GWA2_61_42]OGR77670.1 MAG: hypothetical protein A2X38_09870 [Elusimicrobia bacterium GWC2_61_25]
MSIHRTASVLACALALAAALPPPAPAQTEVLRIDWEISKMVGKNRTPYAPVAELRAAPELKFSDYLRALVTLRNPAARPVEGLVLRYALRLRLNRKGDAPEKAFWGVPFYVEEVRVSKINPASERQAKVIHFELSEQLRKLRNTGFQPEALKIEVMLCPRQGDEPAAIVREAVLNILKP